MGCKNSKERTPDATGTDKDKSRDANLIPASNTAAQNGQTVTPSRKSAGPGARAPSTQGDDSRFFDENGHPKVTPEGALFMKMANAGLDDSSSHQVARGIYSEWCVFVAKTTATLGVTPPDQGGNAVYLSANQRPVDFWTTTEETAVSHPSVDEVGKAFLHYLEMDLRHRGWGGDFDYTVEGMETEGCLQVQVLVVFEPNDDTDKAQDSNNSASFLTRAHYHALPMEQ